MVKEEGMVKEMVRGWWRGCSDGGEGAEGGVVMEGNGGEMCGA